MQQASKRKREEERTEQTDAKTKRRKVESREVLEKKNVTGTGGYG